jgi:acyl transferase domain-containing protein
MSGTNAHVVVESYRPAAADTDALQAPCYLLAVSAKTEAALRSRIDDLIELLAKPDGPSLWAISHTLLCGRHHFAHRCAIVVADREAALYGLDQAIRQERMPTLFQGTVSRHFTEQKALQLYGNELLTRCDGLLNDPASYQEALCALADLDCQGYQLAWQDLHSSAKPHRISLPTYPFAKERYWVGDRQETRKADILAFGQVGETKKDSIPPTAKVNGFDQLAYEKLLDRLLDNTLSMAGAADEAAKLLS